MENQELPISHIHYHGWWWPGEAKSQGISSHDIGLIGQKVLGPRTLRVKVEQTALQEISRLETRANGRESYVRCLQACEKNFFYQFDYEFN